MKFTAAQREAIKRSQASVAWFLRTFGRIKHPSAGILPFHPFSYQRKAIREFRKFKHNIFRKCFAAGSMVWTPVGPRPIETIKAGEEVYSYDVKTGAMVIGKVKAAWESGEKNTVIVRTKTGHRSSCTNDHRFHTRRGWAEAGLLTVNDVITEVHEPARYNHANKSEAILLGYLLTDGCYSGSGNGNQFHFTNTCWKYLLEYQKHFELRFGKRLKIKLHNKAGKNKSTKNSYRLLSSDGGARRWLQTIGIWGHKAECKQFPQEVFTWDNRSIGVLLNRMFAGDWWYSGSHCNEVGIGSESVLLLHQIKQLLSRFQIDSMFYPATGESLAKLRIFGTDNFKRFVDQIGIFGKDPRHVPTTQGFFRARQKGQVKSVKPGPKSRVYDLEIDQHHNFIVDGAVAHNCRQAGVSKISGAFALWFAMFNPHKTILIVSRTDDTAMEFLRDQVLFLFDHLPEWMREAWKPVKRNDHELHFPNGSKIKSLTSHPDVLRSNASSLNIIDEAAFIQNMDILWAGGWSCARSDTLIQTADGLMKLGHIGDRSGSQWQKLDLDVQTDSGLKKADSFFVNGEADTVIVDTALGVEFEATAIHQIRKIDINGDYVWSELGNLQPGDLIPSLPGQFNGKRRLIGHQVELSPDLAEIVGLYVGDGSISFKNKRFTIVFDPQDADARDASIVKLNSLAPMIGLTTRAYPQKGHGTLDLRINSTILVHLMKSSGLMSKTKPQDAEIPEVILKSDRLVLCAFLRGLFEADGWCYPSGHVLHLGMSSSSKKLIEQVQTALHALGIISRTYLQKNTEGRFSDAPYWRLDIKDAANKILFRELIGFISKRKSEALRAFVSDTDGAEIDHPVLVREFASVALKAILAGKSTRQCSDGRYWNLMRIRRIGRVRLDVVRELAAEFGLTDRLSTYVKQGFYFDSVASLRIGRCETFDLSVPESNTYFANGLISHNTLQHGGNVIVISTTNGVGNWFWSAATDAEAGVNSFNPIIINWWDMDWVIEYTDPLSKEHKRIAPRDNLVECKGQVIVTEKHGEIRLDPIRYGPYWSPWLEQQYRGLQEKGEGWKFEQEVLAQFVGSGNTVLSKEVLAYVRTTVKEPAYKVSGLQQYVHPVTGSVEEMDFSFSDPAEGLWIWEKPVLAKPVRKRGNTIIDHGASAHSYVMGIDIATGKGRDFSTIEVFNIMTREQVAEMMVHCLPREFVKFIDRVGRWYNCALAVVERNNGGDHLIDELRHNVMYPRIWRKKDINDKPRPQTTRLKQRALKVAPYGFSTSSASKPILNKFLVDFIRDNDEGYSIYSSRLLRQFETYVRKRDRSGRDTLKTEAEDGAGNFDDLVMACALGLVGTSDAYMVDAGNLMPLGPNGGEFKSQKGPMILSDGSRIDVQEEYAMKGGPGLLMPMSLSPTELPETSAQRILDAYTIQLGGIPISGGKPIVTPKRFFYERE